MGQCVRCGAYHKSTGDVKIIGCCFCFERSLQKLKAERVLKEKRGQTVVPRQLSPFTFCSSFDSCNAPICPLDLERNIRIKLEKEISCNARLETRLEIAGRFGIKPYTVLLAREKQRYNQPDSIDFRSYVENYGKPASELKPIEEVTINGIKIQK